MVYCCPLGCYVVSRGTAKELFRQPGLFGLFFAGKVCRKQTGSVRSRLPALPTCHFVLLRRLQSKTSPSRVPAIPSKLTLVSRLALPLACLLWLGSWARREPSRFWHYERAWLPTMMALSGRVCPTSSVVPTWGLRRVPGLLPSQRPLRQASLRSLSSQRPLRRVSPSFLSSGRCNVVGCTPPVKARRMGWGRRDSCRALTAPTLGCVAVCVAGEDCDRFGRFLERGRGVFSSHPARRTMT